MRRLLHSSTYQIREFDKPNVPNYAFLSHTWDADKDDDLSNDHHGPVDNSAQIVFARKQSNKIKNFCSLARLDGIQWVWIDICCLNRLNNAELSETLNSQYRWIENATVCYVYLSDVFSSLVHVQLLRGCRWFTRKWTLQELVAPASVEFFAADWSLIGTRSSLHSIISEITGIQSAVLTGEKKPKQCHVSERMGWTSNRNTLVVEDEAYSMLGLFDIQMPILYGEGSRAFRRLQDEIRRTHYSSVLDTARAGMRLLLTNSEPLEIKSFAASDSPEYAILSHTWGSSDDEVLFSDVSQGIAKSKKLYGKIKSSCELAASHGFEYLWVDTCCIDKTSSAELQEAICSMYRWYKCAQICYVYLEDCLVSPGSPSLWHSRWFTRGWTLQELIAPAFVEFYDQEWNEIGTKLSLCEHLANVTGIDSAVLRGSDPTERTVAERMSWAASRSTTRVEDTAYCLMGLFNVFMPMLYGEGSRAFTRLQEEIMKQSEDYTIFAWKASFMSGKYRGLLAHSPDEFLGGGGTAHRKFEVDRKPEHPPMLTSRGLLVDLLVKLNTVDRGSTSKSVIYLAWIGTLKQAPGGSVVSGSAPQGDALLCIQLRNSPLKPQNFVRISPGKLFTVPKSDSSKFSTKRLYVLPFGTVSDDDTESTDEIEKKRSGMILVHQPEFSDVRLLDIPLSKSLRHITLDWKLGSELLYSHGDSTPLLATIALNMSDCALAVLIGFSNQSP